MIAKSALVLSLSHTMSKWNILFMIELVGLKICLNIRARRDIENAIGIMYREPMISFTLFSLLTNDAAARVRTVFAGTKKNIIVSVFLTLEMK